MPENGEALRQAMRRWTSGVAVVTSAWQGRKHGMTVNSFTSISLDPPLVSVTLANDTRTHAMVSQSGVFAVTILSEEQSELAARFAGRSLPDQDRFDGIKTARLATGCPLLEGGLAYVDCRVYASHPLVHSTLFIGEVQQAHTIDSLRPLIYFNREYHRLEA